VVTTLVCSAGDARRDDGCNRGQRVGTAPTTVHRLLKDFQTEGPVAIRHKARGCKSRSEGFARDDAQMDAERWVLSKGVSIPYSISDRDQRVTMRRSPRTNASAQSWKISKLNKTKPHGWAGL